MIKILKENKETKLNIHYIHYFKINRYIFFKNNNFKFRYFFSNLKIIFFSINFF
jgi:hypothetical protein